ncbi:hypothetical protein BDV93DRAFT_545676 [Ceratobasidium sp. AG-I]|nr:hypothetical protein BDV93DRAFT_545676 [Ceratobasidium sp. AG-I]
MFTNALEDIVGLKVSKHLRRFTAITVLAGKNFASTLKLHFPAKSSRRVAGDIIKFFDAEKNLGAYCAVVEAAESYATYWSQETVFRLRHTCCCPSLIIALAGPWMDVLGTAYLERVVVQPLTEYTWLGHHPQQGRRLAQLTRVFNAATISIDQPKSYYRSLCGDDPLEPTDSMRFSSYIWEYTDSVGNIVRFKDLDFEYGFSTTGPVFTARTKNEKHIMVKFPERYHVKAYEMLAAKGFAPPLLSHKKASSQGGFPTIITEDLRFITLQRYLKYHREEILSKLESVRGDIRQPLEVLHGEGLVFGHLRASNISVAELNDDKVRGVLGDFDWCGEDNVARHPAVPEKSEGIQCADGVERKWLISKQHDLEMFEKLFG